MVESGCCTNTWWWLSLVFLKLLCVPCPTRERRKKSDVCFALMADWLLRIGRDSPERLILSCFRNGIHCYELFLTFLSLLYKTIWSWITTVLGKNPGMVTDVSIAEVRQAAYIFTCGFFVCFSFALTYRIGWMVMKNSSQNFLAKDKVDAFWNRSLPSFLPREPGRIVSWQSCNVL